MVGKDLPDCLNQIVDAFLKNGDEHRGLVVLNCSSPVLAEPSSIKSIASTKS